MVSSRSPYSPAARVSKREKARTRTRAVYLWHGNMRREKQGVKIERSGYICINHFLTS